MDHVNKKKVENKGIRVISFQLMAFIYLEQYMEKNIFTNINDVTKLSRRKSTMHFNTGIKFNTSLKFQISYRWFISKVFIALIHSNLAAPESLIKINTRGTENFPN